MRKSLLIAVVLAGCMVPPARADEPGPVLPNPTVNIQQPPLGRPMPAPRPRVSRPDPPAKIAAVKKSSRPERRKSKRKPESRKARPAVEAKAKSSTRRPSAAKIDKAAAKAAASSVKREKQKAPAPAHPLRKPPVEAAGEAVQALPPRAPESDPIMELRKPDLEPPVQQDVAPEQQLAEKAPPSDHQESAGGEQTAAVSRQEAPESQEERTLWWSRQGSPAVARFRDCSSAFAARTFGKDKTATWADLLIRAAEGDCRVAFNEMANVLSARLGDNANSVIKSLIETTFLPAARKAVSSTQRVAGGKSDPAPATPAPAK